MRPSHRPAGHRPHGPPIRPMRSNMNGARPKRTSAVRPQYKAPWVPTVNRNFPPVNRKLPTGNLNVFTVCCCCSRHVNTARPKVVINRRNRVKDVQASACWVWKSIKPNSASIILKRYDYVDSKSKVHQSRAKAVVAKVSTSSSTPAVSSEVSELKDMVRALLLDKKTNPQLQLHLLLQLQLKQLSRIGLLAVVLTRTKIVPLPVETFIETTSK
nr:hypothetical protein [Tanacetum cinerariifolium]